MRSVFVVAMICLASACALESTDDLSHDEVGGIAQPIFGGVSGSQRGIVGLAFLSNNCPAGRCGLSTCTGVIVADGVILTAGHCLRNAGWGSAGAATTVTGDIAITSMDPSSNTHRCLSSSEADIAGVCDARSAGDVVTATGMIHSRSISNSAQFDIGIINTGMSWRDFGVSRAFSARMAISSTREGTETTALVKDDSFKAVGFGLTGSTADMPGLRTDRDEVVVDEVTNSSSTGMMLRNNATSVRMCRGDSGSPAYFTSPGDLPITAGVLSIGTQSFTCNPEGTEQMWTMLQTSADFIQNAMRNFGKTCTTIDIAMDTELTLRALDCSL